MGRGWLHEYEIFLLHEEDGGLLAILPDTHIERFAMRERKWENRRGGTKEYQLDETENGYLLTSWEEGVYKAYCSGQAFL